MMARIMALAQNQMGHMLNGTASHSQMGTEFIKSFLILNCSFEEF